MANEFNQSDIEERAKAYSEAASRNFPFKVEMEDGITYELMRLINGMPEYYTTLNARASITTGTNHIQTGGRSHLNLSGRDMIVGEWDAGAVLLDHQELIGRVVQRDGATDIHNHAVHVAGTLIASGVNPEAQGMAREATLWAQDWSFDSGEMAQNAAEGLLISNHSYGSISGWAFGDWSGTSGWHWWGDISVDPQEDYKFGYYNNRASQWDQIAQMAPNYLIVKSAGNNRGDNFTGSHWVFDRDIREWVESEEFREASGGTDGYDCLPTYSNAKNILTVGAVGTIGGGYTNPSDVRMSSFSSWGPTDDGRIKPDIVGDGINLLSSNGNATTAYSSSSGTSMSGPNVAGSLLLIQELHRELHGHFMLSSSLKGLAIHTADEAGANPGPDYSFGWGLLNAEKAAKFLLNDGNNQLIEEFLHPNDTLRIPFFGNDEDLVKATLCWIDPPATPLPPSLNDPTLRLINDLDMRIIAISGPDSGSVYQPYILDPANPSNPASQGDNFRDNIEMVDPGMLPSGEYIVQITHKGDLDNAEPQLFSLLLSSPPSTCKISTEIVNVTNPICHDSFDGSLQIQALNGEGAISYSADGINFDTSSIFEGLPAGLNYFYAADSSQCVGTSEVILEAPVPLLISTEPQMTLRIDEPVEERQRFTFSNSFLNGDWGGDPIESEITAQLVRVDDGSTVENGLEGCEVLENSNELEGKIAISLRGGCQFSQKALNAENAGAAALIIINNDPEVIPMAGGIFGSSVTIPVYMVGSDDGSFILDLMDSTDLILSVGNLSASKNPTCAGIEDGQLTPYISSGTPPYSFKWNTGDTTAALKGIPAGTYTLTITEASGCESSIEMTLENPSPLTISFTEVQNISCIGEADGKATASVTGGLPPYSFSWENGHSLAEIDSLENGFHNITVTDSLGCSQTDSVLIDLPMEFAIDTLIAQKTCIDSETASINIDFSGGTAPFEVSWDTIGEGSFVDSLGVGTYHFTAVDHCGFEISDSVEITEHDPPMAEIIDFLNPRCAETATGEILLNIDGGAPPISILWSNGAISENPLGLHPGIFSYTLTDACGLSASDSIELTAPPPIEIELVNISHPSCPNSSDGSITVSPSGGSGPLNSTWSTGDSTLEITGLPAGSYRLEVMDTIGCVKLISIELEAPEPLSETFEIEINELEVVLISQSDSAQFEWDFGDGNQSQEPNPSHTYAEEGDYTICLTVFNDCDTLQNCQTVSITSTSTVELEKKTSLEIYPNPTRGFLKVKMELSNPDLKLEVFNVTGQKVLSQPAKPEMQINVGNWPKGIYFLRMGSERARFIVQ